MAKKKSNNTNKQKKSKNNGKQDEKQNDVPTTNTNNNDNDNEQDSKYLFVQNTPEEILATQEAEILSIKTIFPEECEIVEPNADNDIECPIVNVRIRPSPDIMDAMPDDVNNVDIEVTLSVTLNKLYPFKAPKVELVHEKNIHPVEVTELETHLRKLVRTDMLGSEMIFALTEEVRKYLNEQNSQRKSAYEEMMDEKQKQDDEVQQKMQQEQLQQERQRSQQLEHTKKKEESWKQQVEQYKDKKLNDFRLRKKREREMKMKQQLRESDWINQSEEEQSPQKTVNDPYKPLSPYSGDVSSSERGATTTTTTASRRRKVSTDDSVESVQSKDDFDDDDGTQDDTDKAPSSNVDIVFGNDENDEDEDEDDYVPPHPSKYKRGYHHSEEDEESDEEEVEVGNKQAPTIVFGNSDDEDDELVVEKPKKAAATPARVIDLAEQRQLLLVHLLKHFCSSKSKQETAFHEISDQLQKLGLLSQAEYVHDNRAFRKKFDSAFSEPIRKSDTQGQTIVSMFWDHTLTPAQTASRFETDFDYTGYLGKGGFGSVARVKNKLDQRIYAIKKIELSSEKSDEKKMLREVSLLSRLHHNHIVRYYNAWIEDWNEEMKAFQNDDEEEEEDDENGEFGEPIESEESSSHGVVATKPDKNVQKKVMYIQMEYCQETLKDKLEKPNFHKDHDHDQILAWIRQILEALAYLHKNEIIHRDLKPANIFFSMNNDIKIGDFGLAVKRVGVSGTMKRQQSVLSFDRVASMDDMDSDTGAAGTHTYMPPEDSTLSYASDIYSLGIIIYEMLVSFSTGMERMACIQHIRSTGTLPANFPKMFVKEAEVLSSCLNLDPKKRPTAQKLLESGLLPLKYEREDVQSAFATKSQDIFTNKPFNFSTAYYMEQVTRKLQSIFHLHGALQFDTPNLLPNSDQVAELGLSEEITGVLFKNGHTATQASDTLPAFARYLCRLDSKLNFLKRYSFGHVHCESPFGTPTLQNFACFDIVGSTFRVVTEAEVIKVASEIISDFDLRRGGTWEIRMNHAGLVQTILYDILGIEPLYHVSICKLISTLVDHNYVWSHIKSDLVALPGVSEDIYKKLQNLFSIKGTLAEVRTKLMSIIPTNLGKEALADINFFIGHLNVWPMENIKFDLSCCNYFSRYSGFMFAIGYHQKKSYCLLGYGGRYDRLVAQFSNSNEEIHHAVGLVLRMNKFWEATMLKNEIMTNLTSSVPDVIVASVGWDMLEQRMRITQQLWNAKIKADFMYDDRMVYQDVKDWCKANGVRWIVLVQSNLAQRSMLKIESVETSSTEIGKVKKQKVGGSQEIEESKLVAYLMMMINNAKEVPVDEETKPKPISSNDVHIISNDRHEKSKQRKTVQELAVKRFLETSKNLQASAKLVAVDITLARIYEAASVINLTYSAIDKAIENCDSNKTDKEQDSFKQLLRFLKAEKLKKTHYVCAYSSVDHKAQVVALF